MRNNRPMVSVIMITYNHEKYIRKAIDSVLMQDVDFDYEILIGDDSSKDGTVDILMEYKQKYPNIIKLYLNEVNLGATRNAYNLLINAKGKYLASCEGDDYWSCSEKLKVQVQFLENHKEYVACCHKFVIVDESDRIYNKFIPWIKNKNIFSIDDFKGVFLPSHPNTFLRRNFIIENKIDVKKMLEVHHMIADRTLMLMFLLKGPFYNIDKCMSCYRIVKKNRVSLTKTIYSNHYLSLICDYQITKKLEKITETYGVNIKFVEIRKILFAKAIIYYILFLKKKYFNLAYYMIKKSNKKLPYLYYIFIYIYRNIKGSINSSIK